MTRSLMPPNASGLDLAIETVALSAMDLEVPLADLWSTSQCPATVLPYLAWALSVDEWRSDWSVERQREVVAVAIELQRRKGTPWAIRRTLDVLGYGTATLIERFGANLHGGEVTRDGSERYARADHWAEYRVILDRPITLSQADRLRRILAMVAPACCHLKALDFKQALNLYNNTVIRDGAFSRGVA